MLKRKAGYQRSSSEKGIFSDYIRVGGEEI
jgi:hypothetical protein